MKNNSNNNRGSMIILTVIGIATLLVAVIGATFAYFTAQINYNDKPKEVYIHSGEMIVQFDSKNSIDYRGAIPGRPDVYDESGNFINKNRMQFTLTSGENMGVGTKYDVYLKITKNEFTQSNKLSTGLTNLVYYIEEFEDSLRGPQTTGTDKIVNQLGTIYTTSPLMEYKDATTNQGKFKRTTINSMLDSGITLNVGGITEPNEVGTVKIGTIPIKAQPSTTEDDGFCTGTGMEKNGDACFLKISEGSVLGNYNSANEWYFELWLYETGDEQNYDQGKEFNASIEIVTHDLDKISNEDVR